MTDGDWIHEGQVLTGPLFSEPMRVETVAASGPATWTVGLVGTQSERFRKVVLTKDQLATLTATSPAPSCAGDGDRVRLGLQAYALGIAWEFDPYFGLSVSRVDPLPHQLATTSSRWPACASSWRAALGRFPTRVRGARRRTSRRVARLGHAGELPGPGRHRQIRESPALARYARVS